MSRCLHQVWNDFINWSEDDQERLLRESCESRFVEASGAAAQRDDCEAGDECNDSLSEEWEFVDKRYSISFKALTFLNIFAHSLFMLRCSSPRIQF